METRTKILIEGYSHLPTYDMLVQSFNRFCNIIPIDVRCKLSRNINKCDIQWCDVLLLVRGDNPLSAYLAQTAKQAGRKVILFLDDDLVAVRSEVISFENRYCYKSLIKVINTADYLLTSSSYLGDKYKRNYSLKYVQINTDIGKEQIAHLPHLNKNGQIKIIYAASRGHKVFFEDLISPILNRLYDRYGKRVSVTVIGPDVSVNDIKLEVLNLRPMPFEEYRNYMNNNNFDIGLAPLYDTEICRSKYFNKYLEYTINGICGIYSDVIPYTIAVRNEENGYLANNTLDDWYTVICKAIDDIDKSTKIVENAQEDVLLNYSVDAIASKLYADMKDVFEYRAQEKQQPQCDRMYIKYLSKAVYRNILKCIDRYRQKGWKYVVKEILYRLKFSSKLPSHF